MKGKKEERGFLLNQLRLEDACYHGESTVCVLALWLLTLSFGDSLVLRNLFPHP